MISLEMQELIAAFATAKYKQGIRNYGDGNRDASCWDGLDEEVDKLRLSLLRVIEELEAGRDNAIKAAEAWKKIADREAAFSDKWQHLQGIVQKMQDCTNLDGLRRIVGFDCWKGGEPTVVVTWMDGDKDAYLLGKLVLELRGKGRGVNFTTKGSILFCDSAGDLVVYRHDQIEQALTDAQSYSEGKELDVACIKLKDLKEITG